MFRKNSRGTEKKLRPSFNLFYVKKTTGVLKYENLLVVDNKTTKIGGMYVMCRIIFYGNSGLLLKIYKMVVVNI